MKTNAAFLARCLTHPDFSRGEVDTAFIETRLDALTAGDLQIRAAIRSSVDQLGPSAQQLFRRLALVDDPTFTAGLAAALVGEPRWRAEDMLDELTKEINAVVDAFHMPG